MSSATQTSKGSGSCEKYRYIFEQYSDWDVETMLRICHHEAGTVDNLKDAHKTCTGSYGLMQIGCVHLSTYGVTINDLHDVSTNIRIAHKIWKSQGYWAWTNSYKLVAKI